MPSKSRNPRVKSSPGASARCVWITGDTARRRTAAATAVAKDAGRELHRVDLSLVVSRYIGETEKNLSVLFATAEAKDWILFFDEADALFGKRTTVRDAHDRYANQEVSYLLAKIESTRADVIIATGTKTEIDPTWLRRLQTVAKVPSAQPPKPVAKKTPLLKKRRS